MRVKLIVPCKGPNKRYDWSKPANQQTHGGPEVDVPIGTVLDHPRAWIFMKNGQAEPEDDEARAWWESYTGRVAARQAAVADIVAAQKAAADKFDDEGDEDDDAAED